MHKNAKVLLEMPYFSQWLDVQDSDWQRRACGICALKMAMLAHRSFSEEVDISLDELIKRGVALGAYKPEVGWVHDGLVALAKSLGFESSFRKEWPMNGSPTPIKDEGSLSDGIKFINSTIEAGAPVMASVKSESGGHLILLIGFEKDEEELKGFYCHDPDAKVAEEGKNKFILTEDFIKIWKGRIIIVKK